MPRHGLNDSVGYSFVTKQRDKQVSERVKDIMIAKALRADEKEARQVLDFFEGMAETFRMIANERSNPKANAAHSITRSPKDRRRRLTEAVSAEAF